MGADGANPRPFGGRYLRTPEAARKWLEKKYGAKAAKLYVECFQLAAIEAPRIDEARKAAMKGNARARYVRKRTAALLKLVDQVQAKLPEIEIRLAVRLTSAAFSKHTTSETPSDGPTSAERKGGAIPSAREFGWLVFDRITLVLRYARGVIDNARLMTLFLHDYRPDPEGKERQRKVLQSLNRPPRGRRSLAALLVEVAARSLEDPDPAFSPEAAGWDGEVDLPATATGVPIESARIPTPEPCFTDTDLLAIGVAAGLDDPLPLPPGKDRGDYSEEVRAAREPWIKRKEGAAELAERICGWPRPYYHRPMKSGAPAFSGGLPPAIVPVAAVRRRASRRGKAATPSVQE